MGISPQTKNQFTEEMVKNGATIQSCTMWYALLTTAATSLDELSYVHKLLDLADHIECHPINIIHTALTLGKFTKVDDAMMKCVHQMVSDDTQSQCDKDDFWKDADGEVEIISKKSGRQSDSSSSSHSYEEEECCCEHAIVGYCAECHGEDESADTAEPPFWMDHAEVAPSAIEKARGVKRKLVPRSQLVQSQA